MLVPFKSYKLESKTRAKVFGKVDTLETYQSQIAAALMHIISTRMAAAAALSREWAIEVALATRVHVPIFHRR